MAKCWSIYKHLAMTNTTRFLKRWFFALFLTRFFFYFAVLHIGRSSHPCKYVIEVSIQSPHLVRVSCGRKADGTDVSIPCNVIHALFTLILKRLPANSLAPHRYKIDTFLPSALGCWPAWQIVVEEAPISGPIPSIALNFVSLPCTAKNKVIRVDINSVSLSI